jgi:hypothetical protein
MPPEAIVPRDMHAIVTETARSSDAPSSGTTGLDGCSQMRQLQPKEHIMTESKISQHGVNDPIHGVDVKYRNKDNTTPHEREQWAADVRAEPSADSKEEFLPEALRRAPTPPLNKRTGRNRSE